MSARSEGVQNPKIHVAHNKGKKNIVKTNLKLKIDIWPQRLAHSVNVWLESPCWEPNTVAEKAANTIKICHCIYTWSIITHHTQASKVFKWMKNAGCFWRQTQTNNTVKHKKKTKPVGFRGVSTLHLQYIALRYVALHYITYITLLSCPLHCIALHSFALHYIALRTLHYIALHCLALPCIALYLHCIHTYIYIYDIYIYVIYDIYVCVWHIFINMWDI